MIAIVYKHFVHLVLVHCYILYRLHYCYLDCYLESNHNKSYLSEVVHECCSISLHQKAVVVIWWYSFTNSVTLYIYNTMYTCISQLQSNARCHSILIIIRVLYWYRLLLPIIKDKTGNDITTDIAMLFLVYCVLYMHASTP